MEEMNETDMTNLLSGNGGSQVDLVLYIILGSELSKINILTRSISNTNIEQE